MIKDKVLVLWDQYNIVGIMGPVNLSVAHRLIK